MIHYALRCGSDHAFDGWFRDSAAYEQQAQAGLISCPQCGERQVARALMAPALRTKKRPPVPTKTVVPPPDMPDAMRAMLQKVRAEIEAKCDYVGDAFAAEARSMHDGDQEHRPIYGEATDAQAEALEEDGIAIGRVPWIPRADG